MDDSRILRSMKKLNLEESKGTSTILDLPNEILALIFSKLSQEDILKNVALVSKRFLEVTRLQMTLPDISIKTGLFEKIQPIKSCIKFYPYSQIHLRWIGEKYSKFLKIRRVASNIKSMDIALEFDCTRVPPKFKNLEYLSIEEDFCGGCGRPYVCNFEKIPRFWKKFPNLSHLKIKTFCDLQKSLSITGLMDEICVNCPNLKEFDFYQESEDAKDLLKNVNIDNSIEVPLNNRNKFLNLTCMGICFNGEIFPDIDVKRNYFNDYLKAKCPKIGDDIIFEKAPSGWNVVTCIPCDATVYRTRNFQRFSAETYRYELGGY